MEQLPVICYDDSDADSVIDDLRERTIPDTEAVDLAEVFKALSNPTRLRIISLLMEGEVCVHTLSDVVGVSQSAISHQLRILRQLRLVRYRKEGRHVYYALDDDHVRMLFEQGLVHIRHG